MRTLSIDIETYSSVDLKESGVYRYAESPDFSILLLAYAYDNEEVQIIDLASGEPLPYQLKNDLVNPKILKTAFNASFELTCISSHLKEWIDPSQWRCTMVHAMLAGYPTSLEKVAEVMNLLEQKDKAGKMLIKYFCQPCEPTARNNMRTRNLPAHDPYKWDDFKKYCKQDVETERAIRIKLDKVEFPSREQTLWNLDQAINRTGVLVDDVFVQAALDLANRFKQEAMERAQELTGLDNPKSGAQLKQWLSEEIEDEVTSLNKKAIPDLLATVDSEKAKEVIQLHQQLSKSSLSKYEKMQSMMNPDHRVRGLFQFYGASRTGRWAGRGVQLQNLPQNHLNDLELVREMVLNNEYDMIQLLYPSITAALSELVRTSFVAPQGKTFVIADFNAIEARVIAWLANEKWVMDVFANNGKIYETTAARMFDIPLENVTKDLRQKGKVAVLSCGYGGGPNALRKMAPQMEETDLRQMVTLWRSANPHICHLWVDTESACKEAIEHPGVGYTFQRGLKAIVRQGRLQIVLPSGRSLNYLHPSIVEKQIQYEGYDSTDGSRVWGQVRTYGGKLVENIVQAIARDCLAEAMLRVSEVPFLKIVMHVHDEIVCEANTSEALSTLLRIMNQPIEWAPELLLKAAGYSTNYYKKD